MDIEDTVNMNKTLDPIDRLDTFIKYKEQCKLMGEYLDRLINAAMLSGIKDREWPKFIVYSTEISI